MAHLTPAEKQDVIRFLEADIVESIKAEGVVLERKAMGEGTGAKAPLVVEVDHDNTQKDMDALDIQIPVMTPRIYREYKNLDLVDAGNIEHTQQLYLQFRSLCLLLSPKLRCELQ